jgi:hypothetical protein
MGRHRRLIAGLLLLALAGCAQPPPFPAVAPLIPPLAAEQARIYFYRDWEVSESVSSWPRIYLNGAPAGAAVPGGVFYRDVPAPETYDISVDTYGVYWYPFKEVALKAGDTLFVKIESLSSWASGRHYQADTFVVAIIEPAQAEPELQGMRYVEREAQ